eukprot:CAMPEP_0181209696 /NCGR_PEP_ID=MMETSP1096-20121128/22813_1 /TAXON_ID=156174 ORGANISM="Chrysochromulina ericina, Strain CCMP281" /NCGR_SAMPLE_ID=MMETSP1096 /ASSEMBLY_ACC=CAM_ASM_000453 /LENGTH=71 /DNA_ID=CAMNT_0023300893 /DNA_START=54 /DNA_END=269 /DNA_ORIENTATION=+
MAIHQDLSFSPLPEQQSVPLKKDSGMRHRFPTGRWRTAGGGPAWAFAVLWWARGHMLQGTWTFAPRLCSKA